MIFGKIEYLNLLPFHVFMKRYFTMRYKKGVPSYINHEFLKRRVDGAFISSVKIKNHNFIDLGIVAKKEVLSVLVIPNNDNKEDFESATSNILARILGIEGEVIIGDKALKHYIDNKPYIDLAKVWNEKYNLPFVFAVLCYHKNKKTYDNIQKKLINKKIKIPQYILNDASKRTGIKKTNILNYLTYISYSLDNKSKKGLKKFQRLYKDSFSNNAQLC